MVDERGCSGRELHVSVAPTRKLPVPRLVVVAGTYKSPRCAERSLSHSLTPDASEVRLTRTVDAVKKCAHEE